MQVFSSLWHRVCHCLGSKYLNWFLKSLSKTFVINCIFILPVLAVVCFLSILLTVCYQPISWILRKLFNVIGLFVWSNFVCFWLIVRMYITIGLLILKQFCLVRSGSYCWFMFCARLIIDYWVLNCDKPQYNHSCLGQAAKFWVLTTNLRLLVSDSCLLEEPYRFVTLPLLE